MLDARFVFEVMPVRTVVSWSIMILGYAKYALKACGNLAHIGNNNGERRYAHDASKKGRTIHSEVVLTGCELNIYVATTLLDMYAKHDCMEETWYVFEKSPYHTIVLWNAIISAYVRRKDGNSALTLYARLRQEHIAPDNATYVCTLNACSILVSQEGKVIALNNGRFLHQDVVLFGYESYTFVGTCLVNMYAKCESMGEAQFTFNRLEKRDIVSWNVMIWGYAKEQGVEKALTLYLYMQQENLLANEETFLGILKSCTAFRTHKEHLHSFKVHLDTGQSVHSNGVKRGFVFDGVLGTSLVDMYAKWGSLMEAKHCFDHLQHRDVVAWTAMMSGYANSHEEALAFELFSRMQQNGVVPDGHTFIAALRASCKEDEHSSFMWCLENGRVVHAQVIESGFESDMAVGNALLNFYASCNSMNDARSVFYKLTNFDVNAWNCMILGYAKHEEGELGLEMYARMLQGNSVVNDQIFVSALKACCSLAAASDGERPLHGNLLWLAYLEKGQVIHSYVVECGLELDPYVGNSLVVMYAVYGCMNEARGIFKSLPCCDIVAYTAMISGYAWQVENVKALDLFAKMQEQGLPRDESAFVSILKACCKGAFLDCGVEVHSQICIFGLEACSIVTSALIGMYSKCGNMVEAQYLFDAWATRSLPLWNTLIAGYSCQGDSTHMSRLLYSMNEEGIEPDRGTFITILSVFTHAGLVDESLVTFHIMITQYLLTPTIEHCTCVIDLFGRAALVENLAALVENMPFQPDIVAWVNILGICVQCNLLELGKYAYDNVMSFSEEQAAAYVLMSNAYLCANTQCDQALTL